MSWQSLALASPVAVAEHASNMRRELRAVAAVIGPGCWLGLVAKEKLPGLEKYGDASVHMAIGGTTNRMVA